MAVKARASIDLVRVNDGAKGAKGADGTMLYATSSTAAATAAKTASLSAGTLTLSAGKTVSVRFANANTAASPTLNVGGTGAKPIYSNGGRSAYWAAGQTVVFTYDGSNWRVASEPVYASEVVVGNADGGNVHIDPTSVDLRSKNKDLASLSVETYAGSEFARMDVPDSFYLSQGFSSSSGVTEDHVYMYRSNGTSGEYMSGIQLFAEAKDPSKPLVTGYIGVSADSEDGSLVNMLADVIKVNGNLKLGPVYRLLNPYTGEHFFTAEKAEHDSLVTAGWTSEGARFWAFSKY